jgi:hypothetical protein
VRTDAERPEEGSGQQAHARRASQSEVRTAIGSAPYAASGECWCRVHQFGLSLRHCRASAVNCTVKPRPGTTLIIVGRATTGANNRTAPSPHGCIEPRTSGPCQVRPVRGLPHSRNAADSVAVLWAARGSSQRRCTPCASRGPSGPEIGKNGRRCSLTWGVGARCGGVGSGLRTSQAENSGREPVPSTPS